MRQPCITVLRFGEGLSFCTNFTVLTLYYSNISDSWTLVVSCWARCYHSILEYHSYIRIYNSEYAIAGYKGWVKFSMALTDHSWRQCVLHVLQETSRNRVVSSLPGDSHWIGTPPDTIFILFIHIHDFLTFPHALFFPSWRVTRKTDCQDKEWMRAPVAKQQKTMWGTVFMVLVLYTLNIQSRVMGRRTLLFIK